jgi:uncharacterized membrane protein (DUF4010 family)
MVSDFPHRDVAFRIALASGIGLLVGLEREWAQKEIGVRTFAIAGLLGMLTSMLAPMLVAAALTGIFLLILFLNIQSLLKDRSLELTTSICLTVVFLLGALVGSGNYFTAATSAIVMMMLLAWKVELERFAGALRPDEIRSAVLICLLSVVIYPLLPDRYVDPWQLLNPRQNWVTIVVIAGIGFVNYVLLRLYGRRGLYYAAVLGGLVNSTAAVAELSGSMRHQEFGTARGVSLLLLTNLAMFVRNGVILLIFAPTSAASAAAPLATMILATALVTWLSNRSNDSASSELHLTSPVSLGRVIKFGALFLALACAGTLAQRYYGSFGFLVVAALGGLVSSASTTATAAALVATGKLTPEAGGLATVLTSIGSAMVNMPLVYQQTRRWAITNALAIATSIIAGLGLLAMFARRLFGAH